VIAEGIACHTTRAGHNPPSLQKRTHKREGEREKETEGERENWEGEGGEEVQIVGSG
jgi:hypothetical protein